MTNTTPPSTEIPTRWVGPIRMSGNAADGEFEVPLATYETPLWPSVGRGARISRMVEGGIRATVVDERMSRSVLFTAESAADAYAAAGQIARRFDDLAAVVEAGSKYAKLIVAHPEMVGHLPQAACTPTADEPTGSN